MSNLQDASDDQYINSMMEDNYDSLKASVERSRSHLSELNETRLLDSLEGRQTELPPIRIDENHIGTHPLPSDDAPYREWADATADLVPLLDKGISVAAATGYIPLERLRGHGEFDAVDSLNYDEARAYRAWRKMSAKPEFGDRMLNRKPVSQKFVQYASTIQRVRAIQQIFDDPALDAANLSWLMEHRSRAIPLVTAVARMQKHQDNVTNNRKVLPPLILGEVQTANYICSTLMREQNLTMSALRAINYTVNSTNARFNDYGQLLNPDRKPAKNASQDDTSSQSGTRASWADAESNQTDAISAQAFAASERDRGRDSGVPEGQAMETDDPPEEERTAKRARSVESTPIAHRTRSHHKR